MLSNRVLAGMVGIISLSCSASMQPENSNLAISSSAATKVLSFKVMTANVCHPAEVQRNPELYKKFAWPVRKERILRQLLDEAPDIIGFQEIRNEPGGSSAADIWEGLGKHGYEVVTFRNNPSELAFVNTIAYKTNKFFIEKIRRWWVSETPDRFSDDWGDGWGRVSLMLTLYPLIVKDIRGKNVLSPDYTQPPVHIVNIHNGLKHIERIHANHILIEQVKKAVRKTAGIVVVTGDFNCFPDDGGTEELQVLTDAGYQEALNNLKTTEGIPVSGTFIGYSFDRFHSPKGKLGAQLDHIFIKQFSPSYIIKSTSHVSLKKDNGKDTAATTEAELLVGPDGSETRDEFCSDHAFGVANIEVFHQD